MGKAWWILLPVAAIVAFFFGGEAIDAVIDVTKRGKRLSNATTDVNGYVRESADALASQASAMIGRTVETDAYALARMIRSEQGGAGLAAKQAVAWVARNDADRLGWSIARLMLYHKSGQHFGPQTGGRYATTVDPYENDLAVAEGVLSGVLVDITHGAEKFVNVNAFGVQAGTGTYAVTLAKWRAEGLEPFEVPGAGDLRVFRRTGSSFTGIG